MVRYTLVVFLLLTFLSCSNLTLEENTLTISSIQSGSQFKRGETIDIEIDNSGSSQPKYMDIEVVYIDNYSRNITDEFYLSDSIDLYEYPAAQLVIDETFPDGLYKLSVKVLDSDDSIINSQDREFSVFTGVIYNSVSSILPTNGVYTDSRVLLIGDVESDSVDPYIIWSHDSQVINQGFLSEGFDSVIWDSGDNLGFNEIKMEIYPFRFSSYIESHEFNLFSTVVSSRDMDLFQMDNYYSAFLFNGNTLDEMDKNGTFNQEGSFEPVVIESFYGLEFFGGNGFTSAKSIFPVDENRLESFSLIMDILHRDLEDLTIFENWIDDYLARIYIEDEALYFSLENRGADLGLIELYSVEIDSPKKVVVSFIAGEDETTVYGYSSGNLIGQFSFPSPEALNNNGTFTLGDLEGSQLSSFVIDSVMVYYRDNLGNNNIYSEHFSDRDESLTLSGDGFYSLIKPENLQGQGLANGEILSVYPMGSLDLTRYTENLENYVLEVDFASNSNYKLLSHDGIIFELYGDLEIKKRGELFFVNGTEVIGQLTSLLLEAVDQLEIDEVRVSSRESLEE